MSIATSSLGAGSGTYLAPNLTFPADKGTNKIGFNVTGIDGTGGLATALSLSGKFEITYLSFTSNSYGSNIVKLTVDGVVIWNDTATSTVESPLLGAVNETSGTIIKSFAEKIRCNSTLLLEISGGTIALRYLARPIL